MKKILGCLIVFTILFSGCKSNNVSSTKADHTTPRNFKVLYDGKTLLVSVPNSQKLEGYGEPKFIKNDRSIYQISDNYSAGTEVILAFGSEKKKFKISGLASSSQPGKNVSDIFARVGSYGFPLKDLKIYTHKYTYQRNQILKDIMTHSTEANAIAMMSNMKPTFGHETVHGINAQLSSDGGFGAQGPFNRGFFLAGTGQGVLIKRVAFSKASVGAFVPQSLRNSRFKTYITSSDWADQPYYLWDEWFAYQAGALVDLKSIEQKLPRDSSLRGYMMGPIEFIPYAVAVGMASNGAVAADQQAVALMRYGIELSLAILNEARAYSQYVDLHEPFRVIRVLQKDSNAEAMRQYLKQLYGEAWYSAAIGNLDASFGN